MFLNTVIFIFLLIILIYLFHKARVRLRLSRAKHPSLRGHSKWSRKISRIIPYFEYDDNKFFSSDNAPEKIIIKRRQSIKNLRQVFNQTMPEGINLANQLAESVSDVKFTNAYRVPFPFRNYLSRQIQMGVTVEETEGVKVRDIDGNWSYDLTGSYGVNVFGYDFYKECMQSAWEKVKNLGPVLGPYHPLIGENVEKLKLISGLDEVSFHMSGTEAVMQAVRLARYHTGKTHLVRFCGAYHGWWDGVQPGIGNQRQSNDIYTLADMSDKTLKVLETRHDIACILINPLQALHPNSDASSDATLINSDRHANFDRDGYTQWLKQLRQICTRRSIVMIMDEVFTGFRLGYRGAQDYFNVQADMVTYGKTLGGGLPVGVVCGKHDLMKRFRDHQPVNISFARGTFNSHPYVMSCMNEFLNRIEQEDFQRSYQQSEDVWDRRVEYLNQRLKDESLPVRVAHLMSIWTILYTQPGRYSWMFQFYLRAEGISLSWVGSGRMILSHNFTDADYEKVVDCFVHAAIRMNQDGWWWRHPQQTNKSIKREMLKDMLVARFPFLERLLKPGNGYRHPDVIEEVRNL